MEVTLHFDGLPEGAHTWFYNCRGAMVFIRAGDYVIVDTTANPLWEQWIERGDARQVDQVPDGVDFLYENSDPTAPDIPPPWGDEEPPRGAFSLYGPISNPETITMTDGTPCSVRDLTLEALERLRRRYMPRELPGFVCVDARREKRGGVPAHTLPPPFERNFFVLIRLGWLMCREHVEDQLKKDASEWAAYQAEARALQLPEDPVRSPSSAQVRERIEEATSARLREWGVLRGDRLPNRSTIYRDMKSAFLTVDFIDRAILRNWKELVDSN